MGTLGDYYVYEDRDTFYTALANFTADGDNGRFVSDIIYNDDGQIQVRSLIHIVSVRSTGTSTPGYFRTFLETAHFSRLRSGPTKLT